MSTELAEAERFIWDRLTAWAPLDALVGDRIFNTAAPQGAELPYVIFNGDPNNDVRGIGTRNIQNELVMFVKAVDESPSYSSVEAIAAQVHLALHGQQDPAGPVLACVRERIISYPEDSDGRSYRHRGGEYRMVVTSTDP